MREEALSARVNSCPSRNLRECEFFFLRRRRENITGGARLLVVPLWPHFRSVIPRNFSSEESALQLLLIENRAFLAGSRPLGTMREEALSARVNSCPSQNLRGCELWVGGGGKNITGRARLSVVPLRPHFRSVIPRNFSSEESALQLLLIENRAFLAGSRPLGTMREEDLSARLKPCPSQNLRGCESWVGGAGGDCGKGTHSCVPLRFEIRFRADQAD